MFFFSVKKAVSYIKGYRKIKYTINKCIFTTQERRMGLFLSCEGFHMNTETATMFENWKRAMAGEGLVRHTVRLKVRCAERAIRILRKDDLSGTTADDLHRLADALGNMTDASRDRFIRSFNDYLVFAHGISPYDEYRRVVRRTRRKGPVDGASVGTWGARMTDRGLAPETVREKVSAVRTAIAIIGRQDLSETTVDDYRLIFNSMQDSSRMVREKTLMYFDEYLRFTYGFTLYREFAEDFATCEALGHELASDIEPMLGEWFGWMLAHGRKEAVAWGEKGAARTGLTFLLNRHPGVDPSAITPGMVLEVETGFPAPPKRSNKYANAVAGFAEWAGAGPVKRQYHELRATRAWEDRVFSGRFGERIRSYHRHLVEHHYRPTTCKANVDATVYAIRIIEEVLGPIELEEIVPEDLSEVRFAQRSVSENTLRTYLSVFGQFVEFTLGRNPYAEGLMRWNSDMAARRIFLTKDEFIRIAEEADPTERIIVILGATLGLRKMEIVNLEVSDITSRFVHIRGKGSGPRGKEADQILDEDTAALINEYLDYRRTVLERYGDFSEGRLVVNDSGPLRGHPFTDEGIAMRVRRFSDRLGIPFSCHCFRRFYATSLYDSGVDYNMIRTMMRHAKLDTTLNIYINVDTRKMAEAQRGIGGLMREAICRA